MASPKDVIMVQLKTGAELIGKFTADLTDAEYFVAPTPELNHTGWVLGHLACSEDWGIGLLSGQDKKIDTAIHERFAGGKPCTQGPADYPTAGELQTYFQDTRTRLVNALEGFDDNRWDEASPEGAPKELFPTLGTLWGLMGFHQFWHIGHITACRAAMKKKPALM